MEKLLNKLIEMGWKPRGIETLHIRKTDTGNIHLILPQMGNLRKPIRLLTSKESNLWQFVCDKGLVDMCEGFYWQNIFHLDSREYDYTDYQYWILESSLIDENKLEEFLLENIQIGNGD